MKVAEIIRDTVLTLLLLALLIWIVSGVYGCVAHEPVVGAKAELASHYLGPKLLEYRGYYYWCRSNVYGNHGRMARAKVHKGALAELPQFTSVDRCNEWSARRWAYESEKIERWRDD